MMKVKHLEDQCALLMVKADGPGSPPVEKANTVKKASAVQDKLLQAFGGKASYALKGGRTDGFIQQLKMPWDEFLTVVPACLNIEKELLQDFKYLLAGK